jgi:hypothetical protein
VIKHKKPRGQWTPAEKELDRLAAMCSSQNQMVSIRGRLLFPKFEARFSKAELAVMWENIK